MELIRTLKDRGAPVILITRVMPDMLAITDRIIVMHRGRKVAEELEELCGWAREDTAA